MTPVKWTTAYNREQARLRARRPEIKRARREHRATRHGLAPAFRARSIEAFEAWCQRQADRVARDVQGADGEAEGHLHTVDPVRTPEVYNVEIRR